MACKLAVVLSLASLLCSAPRAQAAADEAKVTAVPPTAAGQNRPCDADVAKFCADVTPGKGAILNCLKPHMSEVSEACRKTMERVAKRRGVIEERQRKARMMRQGMHTPAATAATPAK